jgi:arabinofuranosyltransferase
MAVPCWSRRRTLGTQGTGRARQREAEATVWSDVSVRRASWIAIGVGFTFFFTFSAYVCDDAFISFRTVDNFVRGYGLRWNVVDRVQVFTSPLHTLAIAALYWPIHEPGWSAGPDRIYWLAIAFSYVVSLAGLIWMGARVRNAWLLLPAFLLLMSSQAFVTFTSSGLETPLTYLFVILFYTRFLWTEPETPRDHFWLLLWASLAVVNRLDTSLLFLPACVWLVAAGFRRLGPGVARPVLLASLPMLLWFGFALVYFGFFLPNAYFVKLGLGIDRWVLVEMSSAYFTLSWTQDPVTLGTITLAAVLASRELRTGLGALASLLYVGYVWWIGGDFLGHRFLASPFLLSTLLILRFFDSHALPRAPVWCATAAVTLLLYGAVTEASPIRAWRDLPLPLDVRFYYDGSNPARWRPGIGFPFGYFGPVDDSAKCLKIRVTTPPGLIVAGGGLRGFCAGPKIQLTQPSGLMDALMARLPLRVYRHFLPGHLKRAYPAGYYDTLHSGENTIVDSGVAEYWEKVRLVTRGPLFTRERWAAIAELNLTSARRYRYPYVPADPPYPKLFQRELPSLVDQLAELREGRHPERLVGGDARRDRDAVKRVLEQQREEAARNR